MEYKLGRYSISTIPYLVPTVLLYYLPTSKRKFGANNYYLG